MKITMKLAILLLIVSSSLAAGDGAFRLAKQWRDEKANRRSQVIPGSVSDLVSKTQKYSLVTRHARSVNEEADAPVTMPSKRLMLCDKDLDNKNKDKADEVRDKVLECIKEKRSSEHNPKAKEVFPIVPKLDGDRVVWLCKDSCSASDIKMVVECSPENRLLHVNTGTHGDPAGNTRTCLDMELAREAGTDKKKKTKKLVCACNFIKEDFEMCLSEPHTSLHIVSKYSGPIYPEHRDIVDAWCWSAIKFPERKASFDRTTHTLREVNHFRNLSNDDYRNLNDSELLRRKGEQADTELKLLGMDDEKECADIEKDLASRKITRLADHLEELKSLSQNIGGLITEYSQKLKDAKTEKLDKEEKKVRKVEKETDKEAEDGEKDSDKDTEKKKRDLVFPAFTKHEVHEGNIVIRER